MKIVKLNLKLGLIFLCFVSCSPSQDLEEDNNLPILNKAEASQAKELFSSIAPFFEFVYNQIQQGESYPVLDKENPFPKKKESSYKKNKPFISRSISVSGDRSVKPSLHNIIDDFNCKLTWGRAVQMLHQQTPSIGNIYLSVADCPFELSFKLIESISEEKTTNAWIRYAFDFSFIVHDPSVFSFSTDVQLFEGSGTVGIRVKRPASKIVTYSPVANFIGGAKKSSKFGDFSLEWNFSGAQDVFLSSHEDGLGGLFYLYQLLKSLKNFDETNTSWSESFQLYLQKNSTVMSLFERKVNKIRYSFPTQDIFINKHSDSLERYRSILGQFYISIPN